MSHLHEMRAPKTGQPFPVSMEEGFFRSFHNRDGSGICAADIGFSDLVQMKGVVRVRRPVGVHVHSRRCGEEVHHCRPICFPVIFPVSRFLKYGFQRGCPSIGNLHVFPERQFPQSVDDEILRLRVKTACQNESGQSRHDFLNMEFSCNISFIFSL